ncbi:MAG: hypothetical protein QNJ12_14595 [Ilumatobacter sp.]|uniref:hypothetical protein n=1 Tax=Ilumatobacter sp. TaxID=1967498 RepID=UPI00260C5ABC|nr:hypothetical protein [Ilumatobacter sp.]MDJ0770027.1 hypothetical protein [Ilumatobacter sp.]
MITTGVTGQTWRASVSPGGDLHPWDDGPELRWYVAADDRWHVPDDEPAVRQRRIDGTPVTETRVRVPNGDVVQRVFSVADAGGFTVVEVENESTMPVAIAFSRRDVLTERPIADVPIDGIELPDDAFVMPLGHRSTLRIGVPHGPGRSGPLPPLPTFMQVVRGWSTIVERASRFVLPDGELGAGLAERVVASRCELALGAIPRADEDAAGFALALNELVRMGEDPDHWLPELVGAVERLGPTTTWAADVAVVAAGRTLAQAGERRALRDLDRIVARRTPSRRPDAPPDGVAAIAWLETSLADGASLLPDGLPPSWLGQSFEVYGVPTRRGSAVSYAIRWHGERPAVLWEQQGAAIELVAPVLAPGWSTNEAKGEALWPAPGPPAGPAGAAGDEEPSGSPGGGPTSFS